MTEKQEEIVCSLMNALRIPMSIEILRVTMDVINLAKEKEGLATMQDLQNIVDNHTKQEVKEN